MFSADFFIRARIHIFVAIVLGLILIFYLGNIVWQILNDDIVPTEFVFTNPGAAEQPTLAGKQISVLREFDGRIYSGYGDWFVNTGPIKLYSYDIATGVLTNEFIQNTEAIENLVEINGSLFSTSIDPTGLPQDYAMLDDDSEWQGFNPKGMTHVFDITSTNGKDLWLIGSQGSNAVAFRSLDGGASWSDSTNSETLIVEEQTEGGFARFYFGAVYENKLYVQANDLYSVTHPNSWVFDGTSWSQGTKLLTRNVDTGSRPVEFAENVVYKNKIHSQGGFILYAFDGTKARDILKNVLGVHYIIEDYVVDDIYLYALVTNKQKNTVVIRTDNLSRWIEVGRVSCTQEFKTLDVFDGYVYLGTRSSDIRRFNLDDGVYKKINRWNLRGCKQKT